MRPKSLPLTPEQFLHAAYAGLTRCAISRAQGRTSNGSQSYMEMIRYDIGGAAAETAFNLNHELPGLITPFSLQRGEHAPDVPNIGAEIRWTPYDNGHLILKPSDLAERWYCLITGDPSRLRYVGAAYLSNERKAGIQWKRDEYGAPRFWLAQDLLEDLP